jgi:hypothetical protein
MPSESWAKNERGDKSNRRASLPHNLKIPVIIFTPPSPSPDINDPDYPEFFQERILYKRFSVVVNAFDR